MVKSIDTVGHGVFHGTINAFVFALPFIGFYSLLEEIKNKKCLATLFILASDKYGDWRIDF